MIYLFKIIFTKRHLDVLQWLPRFPVCFFNHYRRGFTIFPVDYGDLNTMETLVPMMEFVSTGPLNKRTFKGE